MGVKSIGNGFFLLASSDDYNIVLEDGHWFGKYFIVSKWRSGFNPLSAKLGYANLWVRLPVFPWTVGLGMIWRLLCRKLGRLLNLTPTEELRRTVYPRVCVRVDLTKPFKLRIPITSEGQEHIIKIFYENIFDLCLSCGWRGHKAGFCPTACNPKAENDWTVVQRKRNIMTKKKHVNDNLDSKGKDKFWNYKGYIWSRAKSLRQERVKSFNRARFINPDHVVVEPLRPPSTKQVWIQKGLAPVIDYNNTKMAPKVVVKDNTFEGKRENEAMDNGEGNAMDDENALDEEWEGQDMQNEGNSFDNDDLLEEEMNELENGLIIFRLT
uniref:DUF4283 domain-containing protein n=1 Tax=Nelumbo nucifera TaxID=4432 RepID=A0A822ZDI4_NELNU|nr:TPA_asm: hypothetical protein HUJ06_001187 [Nelumbo nucifera]